MKLILLLSVLSACSPAIGPQQPATPASAPVAAAQTSAPTAKVPTEIKVILKIEDLPGIERAGSFWEGAYEVRVADWRTIVERTKAGQDPEETGVTLVQSSFDRRDLSDKQNRSMTVSIPVAGALLERLQQQTKNPQAFLLRSTVRIFDAKFDKNHAFKVNRIWQSRQFPDGEATISIQINRDGSSNISGPVPKETPAVYTIVGGPQPKKP